MRRKHTTTLPECRSSIQNAKISFQNSPTVRPTSWVHPTICHYLGDTLEVYVEETDGVNPDLWEYMGLR